MFFNFAALTNVTTRHDQDLLRLLAIVLPCLQLTMERILFHSFWQSRTMTFEKGIHHFAAMGCQITINQYPHMGQQ